MLQYISQADDELFWPALLQQPERLSVDISCVLRLVRGIDWTQLPLSRRRGAAVSVHCAVVPAADPGEGAGAESPEAPGSSSDDGSDDVFLEASDGGSSLPLYPVTPPPAQPSAGRARGKQPGGEEATPRMRAVVIDMQPLADSSQLDRSALPPGLGVVDVLVDGGHLPMRVPVVLRLAERRSPGRLEEYAAGLAERAVRTEG